MTMFAKDIFLVTLFHLGLSCVLCLIPLKTIKIKGKMTTLVITDFGIIIS